MRLLFASLLVPVMAFSSCRSVEKSLPAPVALNKAAPDYKNPYPPGTYDHFVGRKDYPETFDIYRDDAKIKSAAKSNAKVVIYRDIQRGKLFLDGATVMDFPCSTGVKAYPTKAGNYKIISKKVDHTSNLYGKILDAEGKLVNGNADITVDAIPEGGKFEGSPMPYWMRLTYQGLGMHVGKVRRKPVSHGCIRLHKEVAQTLFSSLPVGTEVEIR